MLTVLSVSLRIMCCQSTYVCLFTQSIIRLHLHHSSFTFAANLQTYTLVGTDEVGMFTLLFFFFLNSHFIFAVDIAIVSRTASQTEASVVLLIELLLPLFGACFHQLVSSIYHTTSLFLHLIPSYAPDIAEVPEVLNGVIFL